MSGALVALGVVGVMALVFVWVGANASSSPSSSGGGRSTGIVTCAYFIDRVHRFRVRYTKQNNGTWTMVCLDRPTIPASFSQNVNDCHLYSDNSICVTAGKEPRSLDQAKAIGKFFCKGFSHYCRTGAFPNGKAKVNV